MSEYRREAEVARSKGIALSALLRPLGAQQ